MDWVVWLVMSVLSIHIVRATRLSVVDLELTGLLWGTLMRAVESDRRHSWSRQ